MEFNIDASKAGTRLRHGVHTHTLSVGDHDTTAMINGTREELLALVGKITAELGEGRTSAAAYGDLVERIAAKATELGGVTDGADCAIVSIYFVASRKRHGDRGWTADVPIKGPRRRNRFAIGRGRTADQAIRALAKEVGL